ncbi:hypothetical protein, partial [Candidatus Phytoplasma sp. AldY-WA1]|uniref:hypothetical protein n=1 Tax=Candidatus Phytoplasma sp. AldY-WA1 TaxID=2852100 RepID=UPI00254FB03E
MTGILNKKTINLKNLLFLSILFILMILNFSFIKVSADNKNTVDDSQDNSVKEQLRQLAKESFKESTISKNKQKELIKASTESEQILEKCKNKDVKLLFDDMGINLIKKSDEMYRKNYELGLDINTKYNFEPEQMEKCRQIGLEILEGKTESITTLTNKEAECVKIITESIIEQSKIANQTFHNYTIAINDLNKRIKSSQTAKNPEKEIKQAIAECKKTLEEKPTRNIEQKTVKTKQTVKKDEEEKHEDEEEEHEDEEEKHE